ncbi:MAG: T9SS type A sorting domain-containing protein [Bacteroidetes bacterium]|nr:T9SS type A sorting domain-containing protein [Bacteroidota bacterium]
MRKYILLIISILFFAFTLQSDKPMGWFQQTRPVNDFINNIFFLDSLTGWAVTAGGNISGPDTGYVFKTTNGGENWTIKFRGLEDLNAVQFLNQNTGYIGGGFNGTSFISFLKTTNGGDNWIRLNSAPGTNVNGMKFINSDTGWFCDIYGFGGLYRTNNGGVNWQLQASLSEMKNLFFLSIDTGFVISAKKIYKTVNGGSNWFLLHDFGFQLGDVYFFNSNVGIVSAGRFYRTTDGGSNWTMNQEDVVGINFTFASDSIGWAGLNSYAIPRTRDGGKSWAYQGSPIGNNTCIFAIDSLKVWAAGNGIVHTSDGGGLTTIGMQEELINSYKLSQNYPNPFNPVTRIDYTIRNTFFISLKIYNLNGKEVAVLVKSKQSAGSYNVIFDAAKYNLSSGIYFYILEMDNFKETRKMILLK